MPLRGRRPPPRAPGEAIRSSTVVTSAPRAEDPYPHPPRARHGVGDPRRSGRIGREIRAESDRRAKRAPTRAPWRRAARSIWTRPEPTIIERGGGLERFTAVARSVCSIAPWSRMPIERRSDRARDVGRRVRRAELDEDAERIRIRERPLRAVGLDAQHEEAVLDVVAVHVAEVAAGRHEVEIRNCMRSTTRGGRREPSRRPRSRRDIPRGGSPRGRRCCRRRRRGSCRGAARRSPRLERLEHVREEALLVAEGPPEPEGRKPPRLRFAMSAPWSAAKRIPFTIHSMAESFR